MTLLEFLESFLSTTLKLDKAGVAALIDADGLPKTDAINQLLEKDKARVALLTKGKFDEGHKAAESKVKTQFEKELKEKFSIESDKVGVDLVSEIIEAKTPKGEGLTEEQVKKHKAYLDLNESIQGKVKEAVKAKETEFETYKTQVERGKSLSVVKQRALTLFESYKPILSADAAKAAKQKEMFLNQFEQGNYRMDGERVIMLNADGTDKTDPHGNRVEFDSYVKETASSLYDFQATDPKDSPAGGSGGAGGAGGAAKPVVVKDEADFMKQFHGAKTPQEKIAVTNAWEETKKSAS